jgi:uncharacterized membrane protein
MNNDDMRIPVFLFLWAIGTVLGVCVYFATQWITAFFGLSESNQVIISCITVGGMFSSGIAVAISPPL